MGSLRRSLSHLMRVPALAESKMISAEEKHRQLCDGVPSCQYPVEKSFSFQFTKFRATGEFRIFLRNTGEGFVWVRRALNKKAAHFWAAQKRQGREGN
jgi:carbamoylphosphate synthase large subunit